MCCHMLLEYLFCTFFCFCFFNGLKFFLSYFESKREREREREHKSGGVREGERIPNRLLDYTDSAEPDVELELTNHEIMTWAEAKSWTLT